MNCGIHQIFWPAFGCWALQTLVEIVIFSSFCAKKLKKKQEICSKILQKTRCLTRTVCCFLFSFNYYLCSLFCTFMKPVAHHSCFSSENYAFHATFMKTIANHSCFYSENSALESSFMSNNLLKLRLPGRLESCNKIKIKNWISTK